jgi:hypothetical protein
MFHARAAIDDLCRGSVQEPQHPGQDIPAVDDPRGTRDEESPPAEAPQTASLINLIINIIFIMTPTVSLTS